MSVIYKCDRCGILSDDATTLIPVTIGQKSYGLCNRCEVRLIDYLFNMLPKVVKELKQDVVDGVLTKADLDLRSTMITFGLGEPDPEEVPTIPLSGIVSPENPLGGSPELLNG